MPINKAQIIKAQIIWRDTAKAMLAREPHLEKADLEAERQLLLHLAGGSPDLNGRYSVKTLTNTKLSTFLDLCETTVCGKPNQKRRSANYIVAIERLGLDDAYLDKIASDQFKSDRWRDIDINKLQLFIRTVAGRSRQKGLS